MAERRFIPLPSGQVVRIEKHGDGSREPHGPGIFVTLKLYEGSPVPAVGQLMFGQMDRSLRENHPGSCECESCQGASDR